MIGSVTPEIVTEPLSVDTSTESLSETSRSRWMVGVMSMLTPISMYVNCGLNANAAVIPWPRLPSSCPWPPVSWSRSFIVAVLPVGGADAGVLQHLGVRCRSAARSACLPNGHRELVAFMLASVFNVNAELLVLPVVAVAVAVVLLLACGVMPND